MLEMKREGKNKLIQEIQDFFEEERDERIGVIAAEEVLDFFLQVLGKEIYNKALDDSKTWLLQRIQEVKIDYDLLYKD